MQWLLVNNFNMIDGNASSEQLASVFEAAKVLNTSIDTIRRWEKKDLLDANGMGTDIGCSAWKNCNERSKNT